LRYGSTDMKTLCYWSHYIYQKSFWNVILPLTSVKASWSRANFCTISSCTSRSFELHIHTVYAYICFIQRPTASRIHWFPKFCVSYGPYLSDSSTTWLPNIYFICRFVQRNCQNKPGSPNDDIFSSLRL
jgi:hypothetical protein